MYYYEIYVSVDGFYGYYIPIKSENSLNDSEIIKQAIEENRFEEVKDSNFVEIKSIDYKDYISIIQMNESSF